MKLSVIILLSALFCVSTDAKLPKPVITNGNWNVLFMYWSTCSPAVEGTGSLTFRCEVTHTGKKQSQPPRLQSGKLKVLEVLHSGGIDFSSLRGITTMGCEGLKIGDNIIVVIGAESMPDGKYTYFITNHRGTNCLIGHRLAVIGEQRYDAEDNKRLMALARRGFPSIESLSPDQLRAFAIMDPDGVREALIRQIEMKKTKSAEQDAAPNR